MSKEEVRQIINEYIQELVGDTPVSCQLDAALREHKHDYPTREEYNKLKQEVERLSDLIGDTSVAEQIIAALHG